MITIGKLPAGDFISQVRRARGISQDDLAAGICDRSQLSKLERNLNLLSFAKLVQIVERLGFDRGIIEYIKDSRIDDIDTAILRGQMDYALEALTRLEADNDFMELVANRQYIYLSRAAIAIAQNDKAARCYIYEGLKVTKCRFHINAAPDYLLTSSEITLINQLTIVYYREGENDKAIDLMQALVLNFDTVCADEQYRARKYPTLVFNLTKYLYDQGRYAEAIALCDKAIDVCLEVFYLYMLPKLIISKACCLHELGKHNESKMLAIQAYHLFDAYKLHDSKESAKVYLEEKFNVYL